MEIHGNWGDLSINVIFLCSLRVGNLMTPLRVAWNSGFCCMKCVFCTLDCLPASRCGVGFGYH